MTGRKGVADHNLECKAVRGQRTLRAMGRVAADHRQERGGPLVKTRWAAETASRERVGGGRGREGARGRGRVGPRGAAGW